MNTSFHILTAEDDPSHRDTLRILLERSGHVVQVAHHGAEAVERARDHLFDLIIMDVDMPELDGISATRLIREHELEARRHRTPVIALTGRHDARTQRRALQAGLDATYSKPIRYANLVQIISRHADTRPWLLHCAQEPLPLEAQPEHLRVLHASPTVLQRHIEENRQIAAALLERHLACANIAASLSQRNIPSLVAPADATPHRTLRAITDLLSSHG